MMDNSSWMGFASRKWFRWLARVIVLVPALEAFGSSFLYDIIVHGSWPKYWHWDEALFFTIPLLVIAIIAWLTPLVGGATAIVWGVLWLIIGLETGSPLDEMFIISVYGSFLIGGILCTLWGWQKRREKHG